MRMLGKIKQVIKFCKKKVNKIPSIIIYMLPLLIVDTIVLLAFYPGIASPDGLVQYDQAVSGVINNWHPAFATLFMRFFVNISHNPVLFIIVQYFICSLIFGYTITRFEKYYGLKKIYLLIGSIIFALIPLNFNLSVNILKDTLYSFYLLLLYALTIDMINNQNFLKKWYNILILILDGILVTLYRHNGILVIVCYAIILLIIFRKRKIMYIICASWIMMYLLFNTVGFSLLNIEQANYANKYGPISHIFARLLNEDDVDLSDEQLDTLSLYVDIDKLRQTYNAFDMDYSINSQNIDYIKENGIDYLIFGISVFKNYPLQVVKYYLNLDSYLYSPYPFKGSYYAGMFVTSNMYIYEDSYPECLPNSKIPWLQSILERIMTFWQSGAFGALMMRPALYMYALIAIIIFLVKKYKDKKIILLLMPALLNTLSIALSMPVASTRYVYITFLSFYCFAIWLLAIFLSYLKMQRGRLNER